MRYLWLFPGFSSREIFTSYFTAFNFVIFFLLTSYLNLIFALIFYMINREIIYKIMINTEMIRMIY